MDEVLDVLCCPLSRTGLVALADDLLCELNTRIARGDARDAGGEPVCTPLGRALASSDGAWVYRVDGEVLNLMPEQAIRVGHKRPPSGPSGYRRAADASTDERWKALALAWPHLPPPLRPGTDDIAVLQRLVYDGVEPASPAAIRALLLGVTPEVAAMRWPAGTRLLSLDFSEAMIRSVWRAPADLPAVVVRGDWTMMPVRDASCDVIAGDGNLTSLSYPSEYVAFASETRRVLREQGRLILRLFARPERREPLETVFENLRRGRIGNPSLLPWRLAMALHGDLPAGVRAGAVWEAWCDEFPQPAELFSSLGWPPQALAALEWTRGQEYTMRFPTVSEVDELLGGGFVRVACEVPGYEWGDRYPTVAFVPR